MTAGRLRKWRGGDGEGPPHCAPQGGEGKKGHSEVDGCWRLSLLCPRTAARHGGPGGVAAAAVPRPGHSPFPPSPPLAFPCPPPLQTRRPVVCIPCSSHPAAPRQQRRARTGLPPPHASHFRPAAPLPIGPSARPPAEQPPPPLLRRPVSPTPAPVARGDGGAGPGALARGPQTRAPLAPPPRNAPAALAGPPPSPPAPLSPSNSRLPTIGTHYAGGGVAGGTADGDTPPPPPPSAPPGGGPGVGKVAPNSSASRSSAAAADAAAPGPAGR